ncbi:hypothetical protein O159_05560 [Leifsonia xyli subsp. cynodontis DSM 46306]|uniref:ER-bound oxygenase mpaB/mpaB'/Rubber oxygenase catalytic domain-containing protein n=1 Tax=Leifsonia xyli subsp. cynodontis DSM 46306 TaxID=1389489 RepID=U3P4P8_LEIXC|nr:oxygenase MpaB family protein [Leifsonia xyli]AGW40751.1 hypothetical protein O159_05560 [Leifsonia xyli subsp. cynodontis DSM 46306]
MRSKVGETTLEQIASEALALAGGGRALLLQIAHPAVGRGVVEHSDFATRAMDRFHGTMMFVYAAAFGTPEEYAEARRRVNQAHAPVHAPASEGQPAYSAYDVSLQLWVAATLHHTMIDLHECVFGPLCPAEREQVYQQIRSRDRMLQAHPDVWPRDSAAFDAYWAESLGSLRVSDGARAVARQLLSPSDVPAWLRPALPATRLLTTGLLPADVRRQFGLPWDARRERRFQRQLRWIASVYPLLPTRLRHRPRDLFLRRLRESMANASNTSTPPTPEADRVHSGSAGSGERAESTGSGDSTGAMSGDGNRNAGDTASGSPPDTDAETGTGTGTSRLGTSGSLRPER